MIDVVRETLVITSFVIVIMLLIEYINVKSKGDWLKPLTGNKWAQYLLATLLSAIPGCLGPFAIVSLYLHRVIGFGALLAALIISYGDEAFVLYAINPVIAFKLTLILIAIGLVAGVTVDLFFGKRLHFKLLPHNFSVHKHDGHGCGGHTDVKQQWQHISFPRAILVFGHLLILFGMFSGVFADSHNHGPELVSEHEHLHWDWEQISFFILTVLSLIIVSVVSDHFLEEHLWHHLIKKHFLKVFLWTFGALLVIHFITDYMNLDHWIKDNQLTILLLALLIGVIPQSGPHLIFITLFASGAIPFSILLANSIVQDGHGALPLLAESKKSFFTVKGINILLGLAVGLLGFYYGW